MEKRILNWINGEPSSPSSDQWASGQPPLAEAPTYESPRSNALDVVKAIQAANKASVLWEKSPLEKRRQILATTAVLLQEQRESLIQLAIEDQGMPRSVAVQKEVDRAIQLFRYYSETLPSPLAPTPQTRLSSSPVGLVGVLTAWCFPLFQLARELAPALLCGNTLIVKPSSRTPRMAYLLATILDQAGLPKGVCNFVFGDGPEIGQLIASHPAIRALSFTGRSETAPSILGAAASHLKRVGLQLSAKNSALVLDDLEWETTIPAIARSCFEFAGQSPWSISRIMVSDATMPRFREAFQAEVARLAVGNPYEPSTVLGPLISETQRTRIKNSIAEAIHEKGVPLTFPSPSNPFASQDLAEGAFIPPTVIADLHNCSPLQQDELAGPVVLLVSYKAPHEGVKWINTTPFGLCASIWSQDFERATRLAENLEVATVWINNWDAFDPAYPAGTMKASGLARFGGVRALEFYSDQKLIIRN